MIVADFRGGGTRDKLKMLVKTGESSLQHVRSTFPGTPSGPAAFLGFTVLKTCLTSCCSPVRAGVSMSRGGAVEDLLVRVRVRSALAVV